MKTRRHHQQKAKQHQGGGGETTNPPNQQQKKNHKSTANNDSVCSWSPAIPFQLKAAFIRKEEVTTSPLSHSLFC